MAEVDLTETHATRLNLQRQHALGNDRFRLAIEQQPRRRVGPAGIGRPKSKGQSENAL